MYDFTAQEDLFVCFFKWPAKGHLKLQHLPELLSCILHWYFQDTFTLKMALIISFISLAMIALAFSS